MKLILLFSLLFLSISLEAEKASLDVKFSKENKQRIAVLISDKHYKKPKVNEKSLKGSSSLKRFLNELDPYSKYFSAEEMRFKHLRNKATRLGVGLDLLINDKLILGIPVKGGAAYQAGFTTPMYICTINKRKIDPLRFDSYQFLTSFTAGQKIEIQTMSKDSVKLNNFQVEASLSTKKNIFIQHLKQYDILTIRQFSENSVGEIREALNSLLPNKPLIIDLRHNPGGDLYATVDVLSFFLKNDLVVTYLKEKTGSIPLNTISENSFPNKKIYLLLSPFTASSAEIFAQAIKHYIPQTMLVGLPTSGKCLAQETHTFADQSAIQLSVYEVLNANKESCQNKPLAIDIKVKTIETMPLTQIITLLNRQH